MWEHLGSGPSRIRMQSVAAAVRINYQPAPRWAVQIARSMKAAAAVRKPAERAFQRDSLTLVPRAQWTAVQTQRSHQMVQLSAAAAQRPIKCPQRGLKGPAAAAARRTMSAAGTAGQSPPRPNPPPVLQTEILWTDQQPAVQKLTLPIRAGQTWSLSPSPEQNLQTRKLPGCLWSWSTQSSNPAAFRTIQTQPMVPIG